MKRTRVGYDDGLSYMPPLRADELLYSFIARCQHHRSLTAAEVNLLLFDRENSFTTHMPNRIGRVARGIRQPGVTPERLVWEHTLFPYLTAFHEPAQRAQALSSMISGGASGRATGTSSIFFKSAGGRFRFCRDCRELMLDEVGELYWRRTHQLPLSAMCPQHGSPLQISNVVASAGGLGYICASEANTPPTAPTVIADHETPNETLLLELSVEGDRLLHDHELTRDRREALTDIVLTLADKGYSGRGGHIIWSMLRPTIDHQLDDIGRIHPHLVQQGEGYSVPPWLPRTWHGAIRLVAETVILAQRIASAAPEVPPAFGPGPWLCVNPVAKHRNRRLIKRVSRRTVYGDGYRGLFECSCGYSYTMRSYADGSIGAPRFSRFGPLLKDAIADARAKGLSLWQAASGLKMQVVVLLNAMEKENIPIHWPNLPAAYRSQASSRAASTAEGSKVAASVNGDGTTRPGLDERARRHISVRTK